MKNPDLSICRLSAGYQKGKPVLEDLSIGFHSQTFVALVGPNGSGKTTMLRSILGMANIYAGRILWRDQAIAQIPRRELARHIGFLPQQTGESLSFSVEEMAMMGRYPHQSSWTDTRNDRRIVQNALLRVGMWEKKNRFFSKLSGGEQQRVLIARALAQEAEFLLLDEPTLHLDVRYQLEISHLLKQLANEGLGILAVYHDLRLAQLYADRIVMLKHGKLIADTTAAELNVEQVRQLFDIDETLASWLLSTGHFPVDSP
ncbi:MAG: ABC transporter ATP-binding protein [Coprothermobacterota bacterium]|nr:ABC transporter ATP-binding protein [Coprothermobacterota bacterium]